MLEYLSQNWITGVVGAFVGIVAWVATNAVGKPLTTFWADRLQVLQIIEEHWRVTDNSSEQRVDAALNSLSKASSILAAHASANASSVWIYCKLRRYKLRLGSALIRGIAACISEGFRADDARKLNNVDLARLSLGAAGGLSNARRKELWAMLKKPIGD